MLSIGAAKERCWCWYWCCCNADADAAAPATAADAGVAAADADALGAAEKQAGVTETSPEISEQTLAEPVGVPESEVVVERELPSDEAPKESGFKKFAGRFGKKE